MARVILVSNRLPITVRFGAEGAWIERSPGGLATGLRRPHERSEGLWIGWPGVTDRTPPERLAEVDGQIRAQRLVPVSLSREEVARFYDGFSNRIIWPVLHYFTENLPVSNDDWPVYDAVNRRFAEAVVEVYQPGDLIWVHDYQLMRVPFYLRERLPRARIGFFLHVPFPSAELFRILPPRRELLEGLLGADLVGFHTSSYVRHFTSALLQVLGLPAGVDRIAYAGREVRFGVYPMGVNVEHLGKLAESPEVAALTARYWGGPECATMLAIDRLDYTKGVPRRLLAFERMLQRHPELHGRVRMLKVAVPSRVTVDAYKEYRDSVDTLIGRIHGAFATPEWVPVHYMYRSFSEAEVVALYRAADVMLVTPLRDGMNLVAKEFVAARTDEDGVLVLSEFAGAAAELAGALIVNPFDVDRTAETFYAALRMGSEERRVRMRALRERVAAEPVDDWSDRFLATLAEAGSPEAGAAVSGDTPGHVALAAERARQAARLVLLLDYDGTLVELQARPEFAVPDPDLMDLLTRLGNRRRTEVHILTGRSAGFLDHWLAGLPVHLHAEHGAYSRAPGKKDWEPHVSGTQSWQTVVSPLLLEFARKTPGAHLERKSSSLAWHWRSAEPEFGFRQATELGLRLQQALTTLPVEVVFGDHVLEIRPYGINKGEVMRRLADSGRRAAFYVAVGNDPTDEDLFAALPAGSVAIHVGPGESCASLRIATVAEVRAFLRSLLGEPAGAGGGR